MDYSPLLKFKNSRLFVIKHHCELTNIELHIIRRVREIRVEKGLSQEQLSLALGKNNSFISHVEAPSKTAKYNIQHLNEIAKIFCCSPKDFWPDHPL